MGDLGELFVVYAFFNTTEIFVLLIIMLTMGAEINDLDTYLKAALMRINKDVGRMQIYSANEKIFKLDEGDDKIPQIYIIDEVHIKGEKRYRSELTGQVFKSIDHLEGASESLEKRLEFHNQQIEQVITYVDQQIENDQLKVFGLTMNYDLVNQAASLYLGAIGAIL